MWLAIKFDFLSALPISKPKISMIVSPLGQCFIKMLKFHNHTSSI